MIRFDYEIISSIIPANSKVLDLGCGTGELLLLLSEKNNAKVQGIELDEKSIYKCVEKGLSVLHSDIDSGFANYPDKTFDYVILNQTLQQVKKVDYVIDESLRIAHKVIIGFPNFAHINIRSELFFTGHVPVTKSLPYQWYETPNLRFLSISDFIIFCSKKQIKIAESYFLGKNNLIKIFTNLLAKNAIFVIE